MSFAGRLDAFARDPALLPHTLDLLGRRVLVVDPGWAAIQEASFLDDRLLQTRPPGGWIDEADLLARARTIPDPGAGLGFIFHLGHCGSTLISRLLQTGGAAAYREPQALRQLAEADAEAGEPWDPVGPERFAALSDALLRAWSRRPQDAPAAVVKATSLVSGLAPALMARAPQAPALLLSMGLQPYLAALLAPEAPSADLARGARVRFARLKRRIGDPGWRLHALSPGELAAASWLAEALALAEARAAAPERTMMLDFDAFLARPAADLARAAAHFRLGWTADQAEAAAAGPVMSRYAKAPEHGYGAQDRAAILAASAVRNADEIARGRAFAEAALSRLQALAPVAPGLDGPLARAD